MTQVAKIIGTGLATTGLIGAGVGIGVVLGTSLYVANKIYLRRELFSYMILRFFYMILGFAYMILRFAYMILGFAFAEGTRLFALIMAYFLYIGNLVMYLVINFIQDSFRLVRFAHNHFPLTSLLI